MRFKELRKKVELYLHAEEKLQNINIELNTTQCLLNSKKQQLEELKEKIEQEKEQLKSLKIEKEELKKYINENFLEEYKEYDYKVDITNCYIIEIVGRKHICTKKCTKERTKLSTMATGRYNIEHFNYYDVLCLQENERKYKHIHYYKRGYFDNDGFFTPIIVGDVPNYEEKLLSLYPELSVFYNNLVPNTYLKKIYYEINNLSNNPILERTRAQKQES